MPGQTTSPMSLTSSSTKGVIPHAVANTMRSLKNVEKAIDKAVKKYQAKLRKDAVDQWGPEVAKTIMVIFNHDDMSLIIKSDHPDAELLETGNSEFPPRPFLRASAVKAQAELVPLIKEQFQKIGVK